MRKIAASILAIVSVGALCACGAADPFRCDGEIVKTGETRVGGVWIPVTKCERESER